MERHTGLDTALIVQDYKKEVDALQWKLKQAKSQHKETILQKYTDDILELINKDKKPVPEYALRVYLDALITDIRTLNED